MSNPNPVQNDKLKAAQFKVAGDEPLGRVICVRYPLSVEAFLDGLESKQRSAFIRAAVQAAIARDVDPDALVEDAQLAAQFKKGSLWTVPAGWIAKVTKVEDGRVFLWVDNKFHDDYPPDMLEPVE
ncbi:MAG: hypothetical protein IGR90_06225 [Synechococcales cyanobacterium K32_A2020_035]|nr:hypothetical protein [Synechococcales cyanobacterium K32_A2020_035]